MNKHLPIALLLLLPAQAFSQDTSVPESVRLMIEQSQGSNRFEQTARMQLDMQYRDFLNSLSGSEQHKAQVETLIVEVLSRRVELRSQIAYGRVSSADLEAFDDAYLRVQLAPLLSGAELATLDSQRGGPTNEQLKRDYAGELSRTTSDLTEANRELVLDILIKHMRDGQSDPAAMAQLSVDELVSLQMRAIMAAGQELQEQLSGEQMQQVMNFLNQLQSNLYRNRSMSDTPQ